MDRARAALNNPVSSARTQTFVAFHSLTLTVFALAFQNYQLWAITNPPLFVHFCPISFQTPLTPPFLSQKTYKKPTSQKLSSAIVARNKNHESLPPTQSATGFGLDSCGFCRSGDWKALSRNSEDKASIRSHG